MLSLTNTTYYRLLNGNLTLFSIRHTNVNYSKCFINDTSKMHVKEIDSINTESDLHYVVPTFTSAYMEAILQSTYVASIVNYSSFLK